LKEDGLPLLQDAVESVLVFVVDFVDFQVTPLLELFLHVEIDEDEDDKEDDADEDVHDTYRGESLSLVLNEHKKLIPTTSVSRYKHV